jgi:hypothetical protein
MRPVETIPGIGGGMIKENDGGGEFKYSIFDIVRTFANATIYCQHNNKKRKNWSSMLNHWKKDIPN